MRGYQLACQRMACPDLSGDFYLSAFMRYSFKVMHDELHTVKLRISPAWARWVGEKVWHESQKVCLLRVRGVDPGTLDPQLATWGGVAGLDEIKRWVLSLGKEAEVIEPLVLRDAVQEELLRTMDRYRVEAARSPRKSLEWMELRSGHARRSTRE